MRLLISALLLINTAFALTGKINVTVQKTNTSNFRGLFWSDVDETVGKGDSPVITSKDVMDAINSEFSDAAAAKAQLEKLKGKGGQVMMEYGYMDYDRDKKKDANGDIIYRCGVISEDQKSSNLYAQWGDIYSAPEGVLQFPRYSSEGKFFQLKMASRAQIRRHIARCLARLPGMPALKNHQSNEKPQIFMEDEVYQDFFNWFKTIPRLPLTNAKDRKFRNAVLCLLSNASNVHPDSVGNTVIIQKAKASKDSPYNRDTFVSEIDNIPKYSGIPESRGKNAYHYSIGLMDSASGQSLMKKWEKDAIQTQGVWPNYQAGSIHSLMAQVYGDQLNANIKACLFSSGLHVPDINAILPSIFNQRTCKEVDIDSLTQEEHLQLSCENGKLESCYYLGKMLISGKKVDCLPRELGGKCELAKGEEDSKRGIKYLQDSCDRGLFYSCFALGRIMTQRYGTLNDNQAMQYFLKGCKIKQIPDCFFYEKGVNAVSKANLQTHINNCNGGYLTFDKAKVCMELGLYYLKQGDRELAKQSLQKSCDVRGFERYYSLCTELVKIMLEDGEKDKTIALLQKQCSFMRKETCPILYDLLDAKGQNALIKKVCWEEKKKCF